MVLISEALHPNPRQVIRKQSQIQHKESESQGDHRGRLTATEGSEDLSLS